MYKAIKIPKSIIIVEIKSSKVKVSLRKITLKIIAIIGTINWIILAVIICIFGKIEYQINTPKAVVIEPEVIAKIEVYKSILRLFLKNKK